MRGTTFLPHLQVCRRPPGGGPLIALPQPHHPPRGSERWRKTGKPTKIFQIRQICGADKSHAGWDEASAAPQWGVPVKSDLWPQKNASSPALGRAHCLSRPQKSPRWGCPQGGDWGAVPGLQVTHAALPAPQQGAAGRLREPGITSSGRQGPVLSRPLVVVPGFLCVCVATVQGTARVGRRVAWAAPQSPH